MRLEELSYQLRSKLLSLINNDQVLVKIFSRLGFLALAAAIIMIVAPTSADETTPSAEPTFFQKNKLVVSIVSGVAVVALGIGGFLLMRPSPAQPYLDKVCQAFDGLKISDTSNNEAEALISAQESNIDLANQLDPEASIEVNKAFDEFKVYEQKVSTTNMRFAIAVTLRNIAGLSDISKQIDIDSAYGKSAVALMDTACGR